MKDKMSVLKLLEEISWYVEVEDLKATGMTSEELEGYLDMYFDRFFRNVTMKLKKQYQTDVRLSNE